MLQLYKIVTTKDRIDAFLGVDCTSLDFATLWDFRCHLQDEFNKQESFYELDRLVACYVRVMDELKRRYPEDTNWPL